MLRKTKVWECLINHCQVFWQMVEEYEVDFHPRFELCLKEMMFVCRCLDHQFTLREIRSLWISYLYTEKIEFLKDAKVGPTNYLDQFEPKDFKNADIVIGNDRFCRPFVSILLCGEPLTYFRRYSNYSLWSSCTYLRYWKTHAGAKCMEQCNVILSNIIVF